MAGDRTEDSQPKKKVHILASASKQNKKAMGSKEGEKGGGRGETKQYISKTDSYLPHFYSQGLNRFVLFLKKKSCPIMTM